MVLIFLFGLMAVYFIGDRILRQRLGISRQDFLYKHINTVHQTAEFVVIGLGFLVMAALTFVFNQPARAHYFMVILTATFAVRTYMGWRYARETKQYITDGWAVAAFTVMIIGVELLMYR